LDTVSRSNRLQECSKSACFGVYSWWVLRNGILLLKKGSGSLDVFDGEFLSKRLNSIVITFNYRLSIFGFPGIRSDEYTPLNPGILDQELAIDWVSKHVALFGGDVLKMTLAGQSAGALSAIIHATSNNGNQLFQNLLLMSPPATKLRLKSQAEQVFMNMTSAFGCNPNNIINELHGNDLNDIKACLKKYSTRNILDMQEELEGIEKTTYRISDYLKPVIDGFEIKAHPFELLKDLKGFNIMIGMVAEETTRMLELSIPVKISKSTGTVLL
jgi:carboxylesterase type B